MLDVDECKDLWTCFKLGIKSVATDGGIGEVMSDNLGIRMLLTMSYFFAVMVVLLNIIFGITIDTFGALRQAKLIRMEDTENICYICGIENIVFDRIERNGFDHHIREDHYMWNYFYFITYIWEQNKDDDDGFEHYVRHCVEKGDITWFPINKALRLRATKTAKDILKSELKSELKKSEGGLIGHWAKIENAARDKFIVFRTIFNSLQEEKSHQATRTSSVMSNMRASAANLTSGAHTPVRGNSNLSLDTPKVRTISDVPDGETSVKPPQPPTDPTKGGASKFRPVSPGNYDISLCTVELIGNKTSKLVYNSLIALGVVASSNYHASVSDIEVVCHIRVPPHRGAGEKSFTSHCHLNVVDGAVMEPLVFPPSSFTLYKSINAPVELNVAATVVISIGVPKSTLDNVTSPVGGVSVAKSNSFNSTEYNPNVSQLTEDGQDDMATMAVASWEVTVEEMLAFKGRGLQIKKHFPAPYSSGVTLVLESQCNLHQEV